MGCSLRVNHKQISTSASPGRNLQLEYLAELRRVCAHDFRSDSIGVSIPYCSRLRRSRHRPLVATGRCAALFRLTATAEYARTTRSQTGLRVSACLDRRNYPCGLKPTPDQLASLRLHRHDTLPQWNCTIRPQL